MKNILYSIFLISTLIIACKNQESENQITQKVSSSEESTAKNNTDFVGKWICLSSMARDKNNDENLETDEMALPSKEDQALMDAAGINMDLFYEIAANDSILIYNTGLKNSSKPTNYTFNSTKTNIRFSDEFGQHTAIINTNGLLIINRDDHKFEASAGKPYRVFKKI